MNINMDLIIALIVVLVGLGVAISKYYKVIAKIEKALPKGTSWEVRVRKAVIGLVNYAKANPNLDKEVIQGIMTLITIVGAIAGMNVTAYVADLTELLTKVPGG